MGVVEEPTREKLCRRDEKPFGTEGDACIAEGEGAGDSARVGEVGVRKGDALAEGVTVCDLFLELKARRKAQSDSN